MTSDMLKMVEMGVDLTIESAVEEAMFHVEHLLCEIEDLKEQVWRSERLQEVAALEQRVQS